MKSATLDGVLENFTVFGRYHLELMIFAIIAFAINSMYCVNYIFAVEESGYRCLNQSFSNNTCGSVDGARCTAWEYENPHSFVAEFQLACQDWKRALVGTVHSFGYMAGLLIVGPLSDRVGRKMAMILTAVVGAACGVVRSFANSYWLYIALEFLESVIGDCASPLFILILEFVSAKNRPLFFCLNNLGYSFGRILLSGIAWGVPYWRNYLQIIYLPGFLLIVYIFLMDESPRWLLIKEKEEKAVAILRKMARKNNVKLDRVGLDNLAADKGENSMGMINLLKITLKSRVLVNRFIVCIVWWTASIFMTYGMNINAVTLRGNKYVNFALIQVGNIPGAIVMIYLMNNYKRRIPLMSSYFAAALLCFGQPFVPSGLPWLSVMVYMAGKMMVTFTLSITYIYTSELFPTYTRNSMHAMCSSFGRIGSIFAPQTPLLMAYWSGLPTLVFGVASLAAGLVTFLVPDTADDALPDTVREAEDQGKKKLTLAGIERKSASQVYTFTKNMDVME